MYFREQLLLLFVPTPNLIKLNIGNVNPNLLRFGPLLSQYPLMFRTPYTKIYPPRQHIDRRQTSEDVPHANFLGVQLLPGSVPHNEKSTGIFSPFSSLLKSISNPHNTLAKLINILRSATCMPGQIRLPPPKPT